MLALLPIFELHPTGPDYRMDLKRVPRALCDVLSCRTRFRMMNQFTLQSTMHGLSFIISMYTFPNGGPVHLI
jgi:hypothetical protein